LKLGELPQSIPRLHVANIRVFVTAACTVPLHEKGIDDLADFFVAEEADPGGEGRVLVHECFHESLDDPGATVATITLGSGQQVVMTRQQGQATLRAMMPMLRRELMTELLPGASQLHAHLML